jgi:hypothetical protein
MAPTRLTAPRSFWPGSRHEISGTILKKAASLLLVYAVTAVPGCSSWLNLSPRCLNRPRVQRLHALA